MRKLSIFLLLLISGIFQAKAQVAVSSVTNFNQNWEVVKDADTTLSVTVLGNASAKNIAWEKISLPHTPRIEPVNKVDEQWQGICFYRKFFTIDGANKGKHIALQFDAAMNDADIYLNGKKIFKHVGGYLPFYIDISSDVQFGAQNCVLVKLNNRDNAVIPPGKPIKDLDFNFYGGIYRNAWLIVKNKLYISNAVKANAVAGGGIMVHDEDVSTQSAKIFVKTDVNNDDGKAQNVTVKVTLVDNAGKVVATATAAPQVINAAGVSSFAQSLNVSGPQLWSPVKPYLYHLKVQVLQNGKVTDEQIISTGIKTIKFEPGAFYLNGEN